MDYGKLDYGKLDYGSWTTGGLWGFGVGADEVELAGVGVDEEAVDYDGLGRRGWWRIMWTEAWTPAAGESKPVSQDSRLMPAWARVLRVASSMPAARACWRMAVWSRAVMPQSWCPTT